MFQRVPLARIKLAKSSAAKVIEECFSEKFKEDFSVSVDPETLIGTVSIHVDPTRNWERLVKMQKNTGILKSSWGKGKVVAYEEVNLNDANIEYEEVECPVCGQWLETGSASCNMCHSIVEGKLLNYK